KGDVRLAPGGDHGAGARLAQGEQYDVRKDGQRLCDQARDLFKQKIVDGGWNRWMLQKVTSATWEKVQGHDDLIRVTIEFKYGSATWFNDIHDGRVQINFVDQGFRAGWFRSYQESGIGVYAQKLGFHGALEDNVRALFKGGLDVRQATLDVPSFLAE